MYDCTYEVQKWPFFVLHSSFWAIDSFHFARKKLKDGSSVSISVFNKIESRIPSWKPSLGRQSVRFFPPILRTYYGRLSCHTEKVGWGARNGVMHAIHHSCSEILGHTSTRSRARARKVTAQLRTNARSTFLEINWRTCGFPYDNGDIFKIISRFFEVTWHVVFDPEAGVDRTEVTTTPLRRDPTYIRYVIFKTDVLTFPGSYGTCQLF